MQARRQACRQAGRLGWGGGGEAEKHTGRKNFGVLLEGVRFFFLRHNFRIHVPGMQKGPINLKVRPLFKVP
jgi:hypothetical protein